MLDKLLNNIEANWSNFLISLDIMWKGMLAIFLVLGIITLIVMFLTKIQGKDESELNKK